MLPFGRKWTMAMVAVIAWNLPAAAQEPVGAYQPPSMLRELEARIEGQRREIQQLTAALEAQRQQIAGMLEPRDQDGAKPEQALQRPQLAEVAGARPVITPVFFSTMTPASPTLKSTPQARPAASEAKPDNTPSFQWGATLYPNFTFQAHPTITDGGGNVVRKSFFDVSRAYLNFTGNISHIVAFRITPDISRENSFSSTLNGSLVFRIKYAFLQANLDGWMTEGSWARLGIQQTPYVDFLEGVYRYRFQGTTFSERVGIPFSSSDAGASFHYNLPAGYGDLHIGVYNGENYNHAEPNNQKALQMRFTLRPFTKQAELLRGLRATLFYDADNYLRNAERKRLIATLTFEHKYLVGGFEFLNSHDQTSAALPNVEGRGFSIWATPRTRCGWEGLLRYDHWTPNTSSAFASVAGAGNATTRLDSQKQNRMILGVAYWFPHEGSVSSALMFDYDAQIVRNMTAQPVRAFAVHGLISY